MKMNKAEIKGESSYLNTGSLAHKDNYGYDDCSDRVFNNIMGEKI